MDRDKVVDALNEALAVEYAAVIQYSQASFLVSGTDREVFMEMFREEAGEALNHARDAGDWVVSYGGVPVVEPAPVRQSADLDEMLRQAVDLEQQALNAYQQALRHVGDEEEDAGLRNYLEDMCETELRDLLELKKVAGMIRVDVEETGRGSETASA